MCPFPLRRPLAAAAALAAPLLLAAAPARSDAAVREYWIKAENTEWDVVPNGRDVLMGTVIAPAQRRFTAVVYRRYTPGWKRRMPNTAVSGDNDGMPGPTITARVGDRVIVHFRNEDRTYRGRHSMHFHAFTYRPSSDGTFIPFVSGPGANVPVGGSFTYRLVAGPNSAGVWPYHTHSADMADGIARGLYGAVVILKPKERPPDRRFIVYLTNTNGYDTIDGRAFLGNTPTFHARVGQRVEFDVLTVGDVFHTFHVHGHRWFTNGGVPTDTQTLGPGEAIRAAWTEDAPGTWYYHCHVESHQMNGMIGLYKVTR